MQLIGDYHTHTIYSHGSGSIRDNVEAALKKGHATAAEIMQLCQDIRQRVKSNSGVELEMEVKTLGRF